MIRVSSSYFSDNPFLDDGCYFLVDGEWMQRWRSWLHRKLPYEDIGPMRFLSLSSWWTSDSRVHGSLHLG